MTVNKLDRDQIVALSPDADIDLFLENDSRIKSGLCPNGHGLMLEYSEGAQQCPECAFFTNVRASNVQRDR